MLRLFQGSILRLAPTSGTQGTVVVVSIPSGVAAVFNPTPIAGYRALFVPLRLPPGVSAGTTFFGYPAGLQVVDAKNARVTVPAMGSDPLVQVVPGAYRVWIVGTHDSAASEDVFHAVEPGLSPIPGTPVPGAGFSIMTPSTGVFLVPGGLRAQPDPFGTLLGPSAVAGGASVSVRPPSPAPPLPSAGPGTAPPGEVSSEGEAMVQWVVEAFTPLREPPGPRMVLPEHNPGLFTREIPVERDSRDPIKQFDFIISARLMLSDDSPLDGIHVSFRLAEETALPNDDSEILEAASDLQTLRNKLVRGEEPARNPDTDTDREGKAYCWLRLRLFDENDIPDASLRHVGIKVLIGEEDSPPGPTPTGGTVLASLTGGPLPMPDEVPFPGDSLGSIRDLLKNILVEPFSRAVRSFFQFRADGVAEAIAGLPRTRQQVIGFALKRVADGIIVTWTPFPARLAYLVTGVPEEAEATVVGALMGIPSGIKSMAEDQINDIKLLVDLPRAAYNFISEHPGLSLIVQSTGVVAASEVVRYGLDSEFRTALNRAARRFVGLNMKKLALNMAELYVFVRKYASSMASALANKIYRDFEISVQPYATDYLEYRKGSLPYQCFVGGFIGGHFLGYILGTVGVEVLFGYLTAGVGAVIRILAKAARLGRLADLFAALARLAEALTALVRRVSGQLKDAMGRVLLALFSLLDQLSDGLFDGVARALERNADTVLEMIYKYTRDADGADRSKFEALAVGMRESLGDDPDGARDTLELLAEFAKDRDVGEPGNLLAYGGLTPRCVLAAFDWPDMDRG